jgi:hypothetical protein
MCHLEELVISLLLDGDVISGNVLLPMPNSRSRQLTSLEATLYSNPSCNLKNSRNAGSSGSSPRVLGDDVLNSGEIDARRFDGDECADVERQICASSPSICRRPFRIFRPSLEEMLSKERDNNVSMLKLIVIQDGGPTAKQCLFGLHQRRSINLATLLDFCGK